MNAKWSRGDQDQMNCKTTTAMVGPAGTVFTASGRVFITLEDVTTEMVTAGTLAGVATAGIWAFPKGTVAFAQFANVYLTSAGALGAIGTLLGIAENAVTTTDETVMVQFSSFASDPVVKTT
ncbi:MAG: hypothetical protein FWD31_15935 [Planctomycetaceae bacterium]|nr:hypothetical protein [Planctomycetaceae bacterium]